MIQAVITSGSSMDNGYFGTTDHKTATLIIAFTRAPIQKITKDPDGWKRRIWFWKSDAEVVLDLWVHNRPITVDIRDVFYAIDAVNAAFHGEIEIGS